MKQILVPTDFSECSKKALDFAVQSAKIIPAEVTLLHSFEVNDNIYTDYQGVNREYNLTILNEAKNDLDHLKKDIEETNDLTLDTTISTDSLQVAIKKAVEEKEFDLIAMGTLGASGLKEKLWGSRTAATIGKAGMPVLAIPIEYEWKKPQKILFATNQFEKDPAILNYLFELAGLYMAGMQVVVFTDEEDDKSEIFLEHKKKIAEYETFLKETYNEETLTSAHISGVNFEETLQQYIKENEIDILVMVTYPHRLWERIFNPSQTKRMSYHSNIPLLAIPATMEENKSSHQPESKASKVV